MGWIGAGLLQGTAYGESVKCSGWVVSTSAKAVHVGPIHPILRSMARGSFRAYSGLNKIHLNPESGTAQSLPAPPHPRVLRSPSAWIFLLSS